MAETSTRTTTTVSTNKSYYNNVTLISHMNSDQLFSILLLLPIDSVLSFAMTCKRFRSLSCSNTLWESICRRDWGSSSVDALKFSIETKLHNLHHHQQLLPWLKLYKQVFQLDSVSCLRLSDPGGELLFPDPRASHSLNFVSDCLVLFGGGCEGVLFGGRAVGHEVLGDVWLFNMAEGYANWVQIIYELQNIPGGASLPRVGHSAMLILGGRVLIYGGEDSLRHRKDDLWVLDVNAIQLWKRLKSKGYLPKGRAFHCACKDRSGRYLYISGGMVDEVLHPAEAAGLRFDGDQFLVQLSLQL